MKQTRQRQPYVCLPVTAQSFWDADRPDGRRTALREAAYIRRTKFQKDQLVHDFSCRAEDLFMLSPIVPEGAPAWAHRPFLRWKMADEAVDNNQGSDPVRAWHICADLPQSLSRGRWHDEVEALVRSILPSTSIAEICGHVPANDPPHVHILVGARAPLARRYGKPISGLEPLLTNKLRGAWLRWMNEADATPAHYRLAA